MPQSQPQVAAFLRACWQRRWQTPPDDDVLNRCLPPPQGTQAVYEDVSQFHSACSEPNEFALSLTMCVQTFQASLKTLVQPYEPCLAPEGCRDFEPDQLLKL